MLSVVDFLKRGPDEPYDAKIPRMVKKYVWYRDQHRCKICGKKLNYHDGDDCTIDHLLPRKHGGSSLNTANLQLLCKRCNQKKADRLISNEDLKKELGLD